MNKDISVARDYLYEVFVLKLKTKKKTTTKFLVATLRSL